MALLDYTFLDEDEEQKGALDYSFMDDDKAPVGSSPAAQPDQPAEFSNLVKVGKRFANINAGAVTGLAEIAARQDPKDLDLVADFTDPDNTWYTPYGLKIVDHVASAVTKGLVDIADMFTKGDVRKDIKAANKVVSMEAREALGSPELQYTGNEVQKLGWEIGEATLVMAPALLAGWATKNPATTFGIMGAQVAGNTYNRYMDETGDHDRSMAAVKFNVAAELIPETIPVLAFLRKTKAGAGLKRFLEGSVGEGAQEMLTEILQSSYDSVELENMSLKEAIQNIKWGQVGHAGLIGFGVGTTLVTPGVISDVMAKPGEPQPPGGPRTIQTPGGGTTTIEGTPAVQDQVEDALKTTGPPITDSLDLEVVAENIKAEVFGGKGLVEAMMAPDPFGQEVPVELPTGLPENVVPITPESQPVEPKKQEPVEEVKGPVSTKKELRPDEVETGRPVKFTYSRNLEPAPDLGSRFGQDIEPAGRYMTSVSKKLKLDTPGFEYGDQEFKNPLVVDFGDGYGKKGNWKNVISDRYGGAKGEKLSQAIRKNGYDGIITVDETATGKDRYVSEIVDLAERSVPGEELNTLIDEVANEAATSPKNDLTEPTEAQKEAGNYKKGTLDSSTVPWLAGMDIAIENPAGSKRQPEWPALKNAYGYFKRTEAFDGDEVDVFIGPDMAEQPKEIFVIDQVDPKTGKPDEHKIVLGVNSVEEAKKVYLANYEKGWKGVGDIKTYAFDDFKTKLKEGFFKNSTPSRRLFPKQEALKKGKAKKPKPTKLAKKSDKKPILPVLKVEPIKPTGKTTSIYITAIDSEIKAKVSVVEGSALTISNDQDGNINPAYPKELQPRNRKKGASLLQIQKMASNLRPEILDDNGQSNGGSPIVGPDGVVESGNGRTLAILRAYQTKKGDAYRTYLKQNASSYGVTEAEIDAMDNPVLVRVRTGDMTMDERAEFARQSNQAGTAPMTPTENAQADAKRISDEDMLIYAPSDQGNILAGSNESFLKKFGSRLGDLEVGGLSTPDGRWTKQFADRVQAAVFYKAYGSESLLSLTAEEADPDIKNVLNALNQAAPAFARARAVKKDLGDLDIVSDLVAAIDLLRQAKTKGSSISDMVAQGGLFGGVDQVAGQIATFIEGSMRSAKKMGTGFSAMANALESELQNQSQEGLFDLAPITKSDLVEAANRTVGAEYGEADLFGGDLLAKRGDPYAAMAGKNVSYQVEVEDTGESYTATIDAGAAMAQFDTRIQSLKELRGCI